VSKEIGLRAQREAEIILKKESGIILRLPYFLIISGFY